MEIRVHGRGGQGGVTCAKILATVYADLGRSVQTFGDYAGERSGAPVRAYLRVSDEAIRNRNKVYEPDHVLVLDPNLLGSDVLAGLPAGGTILVNSPLAQDAFDAGLDGFRLVTVDATAIARRHGIGTRSVVIVNTTIAGAFVRAFDLPLEALRKAYDHLGFGSNFDAAREAYEGAQVRAAKAKAEAPRGDEAPSASASASTPAPAAPAQILPLTQHVHGPPTGLQTGSWRAQAPRYVQHRAPCSAICPAGNDVIGFVQTLHREGEAAAARVLAETTPLPSICGRVCPAPCMDRCNRVAYDGAVNVRGLERWIGDHEAASRPKVAAGPGAKRVAIVGGGPAGLSAAAYVVRRGHRATIFEGEEVLGGVLSTGIPSFRLPPDVVEREVAALLETGVEARCGEFLDRTRVEALAGGFDAVILSTGLRNLRALSAPGIELAGVEQGVPFLRRVNLGGGVSLSGRVVVLGGGNTAMDCARSALRAGADTVTIAYRRTRLEMPAIEEEILHAEHEGVRLLFQRQPVAFYGGDRVATVELAEVEMGEPDASGRRRPLVTERREQLACDGVLLALGQTADLGLLPVGWELRGGRVWRGDTPLRVFAAGDVSTGDGTVAHAIGDGRRAAARALVALGAGDAAELARSNGAPVAAEQVHFHHFARAQAAPDRLVAAKLRVRDFREISRGLSDSKEAERCLSCGSCTGCDTCVVLCPEGIIRRTESGYEIDLTFCKGCGICVEECPRLAMEMTT